MALMTLWEALTATVRDVPEAIYQALCGLSRGGHHYLTTTDGRRLKGVCRLCGHETPGWPVLADLRAQDEPRRGPRQRP